jgi:hypothetical protein
MQDRVKGPAIGLIVIGAIGALMCLAGIFAQGAMESLYKAAHVPDETLRQMQEMRAGMLFNVIVALIGVAGSAFVIYGGVQMMNLRGRTMAIVASILVMIPCFTSCCCIVGIPVGIWALVVLFNDEVKAAFTS